MSDEGFGKPVELVDVERDAYRAVPPRTWTIAARERQIYIFHPQKRFPVGMVCDHDANLLAASEDLDALHAAAWLLSGNAARARCSRSFDGELNDPTGRYGTAWVEELLKGAHT